MVVSHGGPLAKKLVIPGQFPETSVCKLSLAPFQFSVLISFFMSKSLNKSESNNILTKMITSIRAKHKNKGKLSRR